MQIKVKLPARLKGREDAIIGAMARELGVRVLPHEGTEDGKSWQENQVPAAADLEDEIYLSLAAVFADMYKEMLEVLGMSDVRKSLEAHEPDKEAWARRFVERHPDGKKLSIGGREVRYAENKARTSPDEN